MRCLLQREHQETDLTSVMELCNWTGLMPGLMLIIQMFLFESGAKKAEKHILNVSQFLHLLSS